MFENLVFLSPWMLGALAAVPVLWWLLRVMPPQSRTLRFPPFFLLKDITTPLKSAAHTPWWLLLLRSLTAILFIIAFAEPVLNPAEELPGGRAGEVLIVIDNGWASASGWEARQDRLKEFLRQIGRSGRPVIFLPTAASGEDGRAHVYGPMEAVQAEEWANRLKPQPWPTAHKDVLALAQDILSKHKVTYSVFLSDGITPSPDDTRELLKLIQAQGGGLSLVTDEEVNDPYILRQEVRKSGQPGFSLERMNALPQDKPLRLLALSTGGAVADELKLDFPAGKTEYAFSWDMLPEVRDKTARLMLREPGMASGVILAGAGWRQHQVGIIADAASKENRDFLSEVYYLRRALEAEGRITIDKLDTLLKSAFSALILPDSTPLTAAEKTELSGWVRQGGFLIRFAGPNLAAHSEDVLLPVPLRTGQRAMEGAMTWEKPVRLGGISAQSPLYGLSVPQDVTVTRQVLAEPSPEVFEKTWLHLEDGTPLATGGRMGKGTVVLIHTSAGPDWSNFCYSGLFVESLQRMVSLSNGISGYKAQIALPPLFLLDGFGRLETPDSRTIATPIAPGQAFEPSPQTPPGVYGNAQEFRAFNLGDALPKMQALVDIPPVDMILSYHRAGEIDLKAFFIKWALLLLLLDTLVTFRLRGIVVFAPVFLSVFFAAPALAAGEEKELVSGIYLAYIETGDQDIDRTSFNGLTGLGEVISARTTVKIKGVVVLNPAKDLLAWYPVIYWPMSARQEPLSGAAAGNIRDYLSHGGMILFDTRDRQFGGAEDIHSAPGTRKLRELTQDIQIPELVDIPKDHILSRSFYLLDDFPGRYAGGKLWIEREPSPRHDAVTSVIIGSNDWAAAWSKDAADRSRFMIEPGGEEQREMARRFGVNLVMAALTGNYKADQVHVPYILERLGR
ncbi:MAG: DUF4159 domain-containing protein [Pseudomonadota bacterium]